MKIIQIATMAGPGAQAGGVWSVASSQTQVLRATGMSVQLLAGWFGSLPDSPKEFEADILVRLRQPFIGQKIRGLVPKGLCRSLNPLLRNADVAHVHLARDFLTSCSVLLIKRAGVPIVAQPHGMIQIPKKTSTRIFDLVFRHIYLRNVSLWLALGEEEASQLTDYGVPRSKIQRVSNSVPRPKKHWSPGSRPVISFVGRMHPIKRPELLLHASLDLLKEGYDFDVVFAGPDQGMLDKLTSTSADSQYKSNIIFAGTLPRKDVTSLFQRSWLTVTPSLHDVFPMSVVEALAIGCPVAISCTTGISAIIEESDAGITFNGTMESLREAIREILEDSGRRGELSQKGRALYEKVWSPEQLADDLCKAYTVISS